jgi:hypothetical protein
LHCYQIELLAHCPRQFLVSGYPYQRIAKVVVCGKNGFTVIYFI